MNENDYRLSPRIVDTALYFLYYNVLVTVGLTYVVDANKQWRVAMAEKEVLIDWIKKHKKKIILTGVSASAILALVVGIQNHDEFIKTLKSLIKFVSRTSQEIADTTIPVNWDDMPVMETVDFNIPEGRVELIDVCSHIRNLHEGWTPSEEKIMSAAQMGYELKPSQTWVEKYTKRRFAA